MSMDLSKVRIETERLLLVPVSMEHKEDIFREFTDEITKYMTPPSPKEITETENLIKKWTKKMKQGEMLFTAALSKNSGEFLGMFGLEDTNTKVIEMGGWLKTSAHGNRYGQEAAAALKDWADKNLEFDYATWPCAEENTPSRKLAESLGGKISQEYEETNASGYTWKYLEYRIPKK